MVFSSGTVFFVFSLLVVFIGLRAGCADVPKYTTVSQNLLFWPSFLVCLFKVTFSC